MSGKHSRRAFLVAGLAALGGAGAWWLGRGVPSPSGRGSNGVPSPSGRGLGRGSDALEEPAQAVGGATAAFVLGVLRRHLSYLTLAEADLRAFAAAAAAELPALQAAAGATADDATRRALEDELVSRFLLSTDFFWNGGDETRPVSYLGFYAPGRSPCFNPFLRPGSNEA